jgi:hypothetical protein
VFVQSNKVLCYGTASDNVTSVRLTSYNNGGFWTKDTISYAPANGKVYNDEIYFMEYNAGINALKKITSSGTVQHITDTLTHFDVNADGIVTYYHAGNPIVLKKRLHSSSTWQYLNFDKPSGLTPNSYTWSDFRFFGDTIVLKASYGPIVVYSFDNGVNWNDTEGKNGAMPGFYSYTLSPLRIYGMDNFNRIKYSNNTGVNWIAQDSLNQEVNKIYFTSLDTGFICADSGIILRTTNGGLGSTGITEKSKLAQFITVYPNPAKHKLHLQHPNNLTIENLYLTDMSGKIVRRFNANKTTFNVSGLSRGNYLLQLISEEGSFAKKIFLE